MAQSRRDGIFIGGESFNEFLSPFMGGTCRSSGALSFIFFAVL